MVVHLKAKLDSESQGRRRLAIERLDTWIRDQTSPAGSEQDVIVVGDFNDELTDPPEWNVFDPLLGAPDRYRFLTQSAEQSGEHTYLTFDSFLDHILVTFDALIDYGAGTTAVLHLEETVSGYEATISDHRPVVSRFALP